MSTVSEQGSAVARGPVRRGRSRARRCPPTRRCRRRAGGRRPECPRTACSPPAWATAGPGGARWSAAAAGPRTAGRRRRPRTRRAAVVVVVVTPTATTPHQLPPSAAACCASSARQGALPHRQVAGQAGRVQAQVWPEQRRELAVRQRAPLLVRIAVARARVHLGRVAVQVQAQVWGRAGRRALGLGGA